MADSSFSEYWCQTRTLACPKKGGRMSQTLSQLLLLVFVMTLGIAIGGGVYEALVLVPIWAGAPPDSVLAYHQHALNNPAFVTNQGGRFWIFVTPLLGVLSIATLVSGTKTNSTHRRWRITAAALALLVVVVTFAWFVPTVLLLMSDEVTTLSKDRISTLTNWWVGLNWVRAAIYIVAWIMGLRALSIPSERAQTSRP